MGLDIHHRKVSHIPKKDHHYLDVEYFPKEAFDKYGFGKYVVSFVYGDVVEKGVGFIEVGYQRKGMIRSFYEEYTNNTVYLEKKYFEKLLDFVSESHPLADKENIINNFIKNYEHGKSFLYIDW